MGYVEVATEDDGLHGVELLEVAAESVFPGQTVLQALQTVLGVGRITADEVELLHLERHHPALVVVQVDTDAIRYL